MKDLLPEYYVFVPDLGQSRQGRLYELMPSKEFKANGFVIIPYENAQKEKISPFYFEVTRSYDYSLSFTTSSGSLKLFPRLSKTEYLKKVKELKQEIQLGNIYEINFCMEFFAEQVLINPIDVFSKLQGIARAPYAALVKLKDEYILSASPELFLKKTGTLIESKPIKGTAKRGKNETEDLQIKNNLFNSVKERTENVMAVDVARNDLSHFAKRGTVKVNKLYNIETFETVHQMVSTVSCELKEGVGFEDIINDSFPMASMTGAPKISAMRLIDSHENFKRNYYSGTMGLVDENGDFTLSVLIRSIFYNQQTKHLSIAVGGAITYLSEPEKEYEECLLKAGALLKALGSEMMTSSNGIKH